MAQAHGDGLGGEWVLERRRIDEGVFLVDQSQNRHLRHEVRQLALALVLGALRVFQVPDEPVGPLAFPLPDAGDDRVRLIVVLVGRVALFERLVERRQHCPGPDDALPASDRGQVLGVGGGHLPRRLARVHLKHPPGLRVGHDPDVFVISILGLDHHDAATTGRVVEEIQDAVRLARVTARPSVPVGPTPLREFPFADRDIQHPDRLANGRLVLRILRHHVLDPRRLEAEHKACV